MAIDLTIVYPGQIDTTDPTGYPRGKAQNIVNPGDGTGTPWEKQIANDNIGFLQNLLDRASLVPSGTPDKVGASQYTDGVEAVATDIVAPTEAVVRPDLVGSRGVFAHALQAGVAQDPTGPHWTPDLSGAGPDQTYDIMEAQFSQGGLIWGFSAGANLPFECTVTTIRCWVKQKLAYGSGNRMKMRISTRDSSTFISSIVDTVEAGPGTAIQAIEKTGLSIDLIATNTAVFPPGPPIDLTVALFAANTAAPPDDIAYFCEIRLTLDIL